MEYPKWKYRANGEEILLKTADEEALLDPSWTDFPPAAAPEPPMEIEENTAALCQSVAELDQLNHELHEKHEAALTEIATLRAANSKLQKQLTKALKPEKNPGA